MAGLWVVAFSATLPPHRFTTSGATEENLCLCMVLEDIFWLCIKK